MIEESAGLPPEIRDDFGPFHGRIWLNCAHQGPLPKMAAKEAQEAIDWKCSPYELTTRRFAEVPSRLKHALARLIDATPEEIVLGNSASQGLHLLANGFPWKEGDEVLVVARDFPSDILPWLGLAPRGVHVRYLRSELPLPSNEELSAAITDATRVFCTTWVHSFSGYTADIESLGAVCRAHGVTFVVNGSQAIGARPISVRNTPVDAIVVAGFKWLCGPYGTGFTWMRSELLESLTYNQNYWLSQMTADDLGNPADELRLPDGPPTARKYDTFGTANFLNFKPWAAAIEYLLSLGIERIGRHDRSLVDTFLDGLDKRRYTVESPLSGDARSTLVFISHRDKERNQGTRSILSESGIDVAFRNGALRISPHLYNSVEDIEKVLRILNSV